MGHNYISAFLLALALISALNSYVWDHNFVILFIMIMNTNIINHCDKIRPVSNRPTSHTECDDVRLYGGSFRTYQNKILVFVFTSKRKYFVVFSSKKNLWLCFRKLKYICSCFPKQEKIFFVFPSKIKSLILFPQVEILSVFASASKHIFSLCFCK